jgi:hypothetical protein
LSIPRYRVDKSRPSKINQRGARHAYADLALARMMMIAGGYEDIVVLRCEPVGRSVPIKVLCSRSFSLGLR